MKLTPTAACGASLGRFRGPISQLHFGPDIPQANNIGRLAYAAGGVLGRSGWKAQHTVWTSDAAFTDPTWPEPRHPRVHRFRSNIGRSKPNANSRALTPNMEIGGGPAAMREKRHGR